MIKGFQFKLKEYKMHLCLMDQVEEDKEVWHNNVYLVPSGEMILFNWIQDEFCAWNGPIWLVSV